MLDYERLVSKPSFGSQKILNENLVEFTRLEKLKPVYVGMCILDLIKTFTYDFHYKYIKDRYCKKSALLFTDTERVTCLIDKSNIYKYFNKSKGMTDFSEYPENLKF